MIDDVFSGGMLVVLGVCVAALIHNTRVYWFRTRLASRIAAVDDPWRQMTLWGEFDAVTYHDQFWKFWKPLASHWPADSRLRAAGVIK